MTLYTVNYRTGVSSAVVDMEADDPQAALVAAHHKLEAKGKNLYFEAYDHSVYFVHQIGIEDDTGDEVALWLDPDHREMLCASELADALETSSAYCARRHHLHASGPRLKKQKPCS